jgi:hypothetical protein
MNDKERLVELLEGELDSIQVRGNPFKEIEWRHLINIRYEKGGFTYSCYNFLHEIMDLE